MMIIIQTVFVLLVVLILSVIIAIAFIEISKNNRIKKREEIYITRKLINLMMKRDYLVFENKFDNYELLLKEVNNVLKTMSMVQQFNYRKIKLKRSGFYNFVKNEKVYNYWKEFEKQIADSEMNDRELFLYVNQVMEAKSEIIKMYFPIKMKTFRMLDELEFFVLVIEIIFKGKFNSSKNEKLESIDKINPKKNSRIPHDKLCAES